MANFLGISDLLGQILKALTRITFDVLFTLAKYVIRGFGHWIMDTFRYLNDFTVWITRLAKR
ncbi:hypothetical protein [Acidianus bottle-shaped virus]|uniref:Uncharacterized protein ORF61b n=1 Tax=Acidianus bottle-shaped virus (isolate Italy/Pozzuoli) TaxID=654911 RepID=Y061B_ABVP|nr:hypothetical protein ABV_gp22 [Acidianus bottle-shaped virus]A4ZUA8.1 RecName: Full=Uncharacterized protein ORF61b [Acidianus bottle-shaped virus (isolate Pozzuoli)]ABP73412.1 hypothetical protein [Acidianus bottle-shaped virus]